MVHYSSKLTPDTDFTDDTDMGTENFQSSFQPLARISHRVSFFLLRERLSSLCASSWSQLALFRKRDFRYIWVRCFVSVLEADGL